MTVCVGFTVGGGGEERETKCNTLSLNTIISFCFKDLKIGEYLGKRKKKNEGLFEILLYDSREATSQAVMSARIFH